MSEQTWHLLSSPRSSPRAQVSQLQKMGTLQTAPAAWASHHTRLMGARADGSSLLDALQPFSEEKPHRPRCGRWEEASSRRGSDITSAAEGVLEAVVCSEVN